MVGIISRDSEGSILVLDQFGLLDGDFNESRPGHLQTVGKKEGYKNDKGLEPRIAKDCERNLRRALLMYEAVYAQK